MKNNIAIASVSKIGRAFLRHLKSRKQFESDFPYTCVAVYDEGEDKTHPDDKSIKLSHNLDEFVMADNVDIVVDTFNGVSASYDVCWKALNAGKHVVTTNATMVAVHGEKLSTLAKAHHVHFKFSSAVLGGVPIVQAVQNNAENWYISRVHGVLNSTCNYVLKRMKERHISRKNALADAIELGYAHPNPDMDISGKDTLYKLALLSAVSYGAWPKVAHAQVTPLDDIDLADVKMANDFGFDICHMGVATKEVLSVGPTLVEQHSLIGRMDGTLTGVVVDGEQIGSVFMAGYGADEHATVASIMNDVSEIHRLPTSTQNKLGKNKYRAHTERLESRFYVRLPEKEKARIEGSKVLDIIETALTQQNGQNVLGVVVETRAEKEEIQNMLLEIQDESIVLNIFRE